MTNVEVLRPVLRAMLLVLEDAQIDTRHLREIVEQILAAKAEDRPPLYSAFTKELNAVAPDLFSPTVLESLPDPTRRKIEALIGQHSN